MLFNSYEFALFLPIVFVLYWFVFNKNLKLQNLFILIVSYIFYGWWDWRFLFLLFFSQIVDYTIGLKIYRTDNEKKRKLFLFCSLITQLGLLGFFKYYNFFVESFIDMFANIGISLHPRTLNIILPVGISFYTFQTLSYTIDVYKRKLNPADDILEFFGFVSFFPQLLAGPIERATNLLPQFQKERTFEYEKAKDGLRQILWGLFKKVVIADGCAVYADSIFSNYDTLSGSALFLGAIYFSFQIYYDFSGYSDMAIGMAKLLGFDLMRNFNYPYFSRDIAEFWRRWHISLSTWFRDYVYIPLGGSYGSELKHIRNIIVTFTLSGLWHGANWTFIFWGFLNGLYYLPLILLNKQKSHTDVVAQNKILPSVKELFQISITFFLTLIGWVFFRSENIHDAFGYLTNMFSLGLLTFPTGNKGMIPWIFLLVIIEWFQRDKRHGLQIEKFPIVMRWIIYYTIILIIINNFKEERAFIYFQF